MLAAAPFPDLTSLVTPLLGTPHSQMDCWDLVQYLFREGRGITFDPHIDRNQTRIMEVWWHEDGDPLDSVLQPWDVCIFHTAGPLADHIGVVLNTLQFVHSRPQTGVVCETIARWRSRLLQVARVIPVVLPGSSAS